MAGFRNIWIRNCVDLFPFIYDYARVVVFNKITNNYLLFDITL